jgi:hypothetical protein
MRRKPRKAMSVTISGALLLLTAARPAISGITLDHSTAHLSVARYDLAATTVDDKIIFAGGTEQGANAAYTAVDIFNSTAGQWSTANLSTPRCKLGATTVGQLAIFAGGCLSFRDNTFSSQVDIYNDNNATWSTAALSVPRGLIGAVTVGNRAYFAGGATTQSPGGNASGFSNLIDVYDATTNGWSTMTMPHFRYDFTPLAINGKIIFMGGGTPQVDIYDTTKNLWATTNLAEDSNSASRGGYAAAVVGHQAVFYGGTYGAQYQDHIDIYDADTNTWTTKTLPSDIGHSGYGAAASLGQFGLFGGGAYTSYQTNVESFDSATSTFTNVTPLSTGRLSLAAASVGNRLIFAGGYNGGATNAVDIYTATPEPSSLGPLCSALFLLFRKPRQAAGLNGERGRGS